MDQHEALIQTFPSNPLLFLLLLHLIPLLDITPQYLTSLLPNIDQRHQLSPLNQDQPAPSSSNNNSNNSGHLNITNSNTYKHNSSNNNINSSVSFHLTSRRPISNKVILIPRAIQDRHSLIRCQGPAL